MTHRNSNYGMELSNNNNKIYHINTTEKEVPIDAQNPLIIISILKGSYIFTADLIRYFNDVGLPHVVDFVRLSSYNSGTTSTGEIKWYANMKFENLKNKHVLIVEDVCDSGRTLSYFYNYVLEKYKPKSLKVCVLANKIKSARKIAFEADFSVLPTVPNRYIIGYGFEVNDRYRDVRHILTLGEGEAGRYPAKL
ncbi:Phosphoribosyl transferase domain containing protein, putative [Angomonas deanei]|uniref:Phosphoribosyl transferase domain containing protein, putative n=1 Tax=Angomonas deanei TaxID=59799 RepID=A0A7G2CPV1_9TRYP|nr:Phosphoribosyl transferase domain containing protein, putative [Angomonas deanei]